MGQIRVDNESPVRGFSDPRATLLNTGPSLWLGRCALAVPLSILASVIPV